MKGHPLTEEQRANVTRNTGLVYSITNRYRVDSEADRADLEQEVAIALCHAVQTHEPARGALSNLAFIRSRNAFRRFRYDQLLHGRRHTVSLDVSATEDPDGPTMLDTLPGREQSPDVAAELHELAAMLPDLERDVLMRLAMGDTLEDIGARIGLTGSGARLRICKALTKVRRRCR